MSLADQQSILVASVPLDESGWSPLPEGVALALQDGKEIARVSTI